ncbi:MAG: hypothetical protein AAFP68_18535 [Pseudomonadota bacterium]
MNPDSVNNYLTPRYGFEPKPNATPDELIFVLKIQNQATYVVGTRRDIAAQTQIPNWRKRDGHASYMQVDHIKPAQLCGADDKDNYQLLDVDTNKKDGEVMRGEIKNRIDAAKQVLRTEGQKPLSSGTPALNASQLAQLNKSADSIRSDFDKVEFARKTSSYKSLQGRKDHWTVTQVQNATHLKALQRKNAKNLSAQERNRFLGSANNLVLYTGRGASKTRHVKLENGNQVIPRPHKAVPWIGKHLDFVKIGPDESAPTLLHAVVYARHQKLSRSEIEIPLTPIEGMNFAFRMPADLRYGQAPSYSGWSPITVDQAVLGEQGLELTGKLHPTAKIFKGDTTIGFAVRDGDVTLSKTFNSGEFSLPGPVEVEDASVTLSAGFINGRPAGSIDGSLNFGIDRVGKGVLRGKSGTSESFAVEGEFEFDPALFKGADAKITAKYEDDKFSGAGTLKISEGQIKGIKAAEIEVKFEDERWEAKGNVETQVPGVSQGSLEMIFDPNGGFEITGRLTLGSDIPRVKGGYLEATLKKESEDYILSGKGSAEFDIPGVTSAITAEYRDGLFRAEATVGFERGLAKGTLTVGATNMPIDDGSGEPAGEPTETVSIYGSGSVTIKFTPWLEGTAGISMDQTGAIEVTGRVALPDSVEVFPEKKIEKEILSIGVDIPIVGVAVAGQRIGIFLNIEGNLTARASIGPGELKDVAVDVTYNPEDESQTRITGTGRFVIPADAGLRLGISGALGAGIPIVSARAGLEVGGELGITGEASASATVEWTPQNGINMEARASVEAQPKFTFDLTGFVDVSADLVLDTVELYSKRWQLASVEFGSNMTFGAALTARVENNEFQPISTDDIEFTTPTVNPIDTVKGLIRSIA